MGLDDFRFRAAVLRPLLAFAGRLDKFRPVAVRRPACTEGSRYRPSVTVKLTLENLTSYLISVKTTPPKPPRADRWLLQDAKTRFSELVRRARSEGPQHVTVLGREGFVVVSADEFRRLKGDRTGAALIEALQASPHHDIDFGSQRTPMPVRGVTLRRGGCSTRIFSPSCVA